MKRILVVDDDVDLLLAYRLTLEKEGIDLYATDDYRKAQLIVKRVDIDLVILDLVMKPRGDLLARRLISIRPDLKIIFISGYYKTDEIVRQLEFKVYGVFVKPLDPDVLRRLVESEDYVDFLQNSPEMSGLNLCPDM